MTDSEFLEALSRYFDDDEEFNARPAFAVRLRAIAEKYRKMEKALKDADEYKRPALPKTLR